VTKVRPVHPRLTYFRGSSTSKEMLLQVKNLIQDSDKVLVVLDSDRRKTHVLDGLRVYDPLVTNRELPHRRRHKYQWTPILSEFGPGPTEAVAEFLTTNKNLWWTARKRDTF
jgi:cephalosporin hydroxylase